MISFGLARARDARDLVHVDALVVAAHAVGHDLEPLAAHVDGRAVRQMAAGVEIEAHEGVAGLQQRQEHGLVHLAAGVRLHVGELGSRTASWPARWPASRPRRRTGSRRSSACPDSPRRTCWSAPSRPPRARRARRCSPTRSARSRVCWRPSSRSMVPKSSGSASARDWAKKGFCASRARAAAVGMGGSRSVGGSLCAVAALLAAFPGGANGSGSTIPWPDRRGRLAVRLRSLLPRAQGTTCPWGVQNRTAMSLRLRSRRNPPPRV